MHRPNNIEERTSIVTRLLLCMLAFCSWSAFAAEKKVIIVCDWDFAPYEFINNGRKPDGFNVEILDKVLGALNIPHEFKFMARHQCVDAFRKGKADLIVDYRDRFMNDSGCYSMLNPLDYYHPMIARRSDTPARTSFRDLRGHGPIVFNGNNDSASRVLLNSWIDSLDVEYHSARQALSGISSGAFSYFIWGEELLRWKVKEYNISNITLERLTDFPAKEIRVVGHDRELIRNLDSQFSRLQQSGTIDSIRNKWFHPDLMDTKSSSRLLYISLMVLFFALIALILYRISKKRVEKVFRRNEDLVNIMHQALSMGNYSVVIYNLQQNRLRNQHGHFIKGADTTIHGLIRRLHPDDREKLVKEFKQRTASSGAKPFRTRWNIGFTEQPQWIDLTGFTYLEYDKTGLPVNLIITARDVTEEIQHDKEKREITNQYHKMIDTSLVAMSFYDLNGHLVDMNQKMRELYGVNKENEEELISTSLFDFDLVRDDFTPGTKDTLYACQHMQYPKHGIDKYIEFRIRIIQDDKGDFILYAVTARDITEERNMYVELKLQDQALKETTQANNRYEQEMRILMENCDMYVWRVDLETGIISFSRSLNKVEFTTTLEEHVLSMDEKERDQARKTILGLKDTKAPFNILHHFYYSHTSDQPVWQAISGMPLFDSEGKLLSLFGIVRNVTDLMKAQEQLKEETARAENSAMLKATFLANMTHEIRTPLNAIVGFSDLLHMVDSPDERKEFIRIIRNNCDMLLRLINDIFEASNMDIKPLEIVPKEVEFSQHFNDVCMSLSQRVQEPNVEFIIDNPYQRLVTILDMNRVQQVITNFVTNAVKYTHEGHIRVGYRYENDGIYIYCEDTGTGIPKEKQTKIFDRFVKLNDFVQGTGLGLSICKSIAERANGHIGVNSEGEGHGSTFWMWVPCPIIGKITEKKDNGGK